ncbi:Hypothetical protein A7982_08444 [Minicystis rosea]|nr:Hypothetical protein A7982_08444 [Minicystis rosea]
MRLVLSSAAITFAALALAAPVRADDPSHPPPASPDVPPAVPAPWGLHSGDTVPHRDVMLYGELGWPDLSLGFQRGMGENVDVGVRATVALGVDYILPRDRNGVQDMSLGIAFTVPIRVRVLRTEKLSLLVHADPGIKFEYFDPKPFAGPHLPVGIDLGIHVTELTTLTLGVDVPFMFRVTPDPTVLIPFLAGVSVERRFTDHFGMSLNVRPGLLYGVNRTGSSTDAALLSQLGFIGRI